MKKLILSVDQMRKSVKLSQSRHFFRSTMSVNSKSQTPKECSPCDNNKSRSEQPESEVEELRSTIDKNIKLNQSLSKEMYEISNDLSASNVLCQSLKIQKDELINQLMIRKNQHTKLQQQRLQLINKVSNLKNQVNMNDKKQQIHEQHAQSLENNVRLLQDELNFQRSINTDLKHEYDKLRQQLKKIYSDLKAYEILKIQFRGMQKINRQIKQKFKLLQSELLVSRQKLKQFEESGQREQGERKKMFTKIQTLDQQNISYRQKIDFFQKQLKKKQIQLEKKYRSQFNKQRQISKVIQDRENRIKTLVNEVTQVLKKNKELQNQLDYHKNRMDQGSFYVVNKLKIKETDFNYALKSLQSQNEKLKNSLSIEIEEKQRLRNQLERQIINFNNKTAQIQNILILKQGQRKVKQDYYEKQVMDIRAENERLKRKVDQVIQNQTKLKKQISEKDRIIMLYVNK